MNTLARRWMKRIALGLPLVGLPLTMGFSSCGPCDRSARVSRISDAGVIDTRSCEEICNDYYRDAGVVTCESDPDGGTSVVCNVDPGACPGGRRPIDFAVTDGSRRSPVGAWLANLAAIEAASVPAFHTLARELTDHSAPRAFVQSARRSAADEVRHARRVTWLANRFGGEPANALYASPPTRSLEEVTTDNAVEGCAREAFGALLAAHQSRAAADPAARAVFAGIASDEARHALLSFAIADWSAERVGARGRRRLDEARRQELAQLASSHETDPQISLCRALGLPTAERAQEMITLLA